MAQWWSNRMLISDDAESAFASLQIRKTLSPLGAPAAASVIENCGSLCSPPREGVKDSAVFRRDVPGATLIVGVSLTSCICRAIVIQWLDDF